MNMNNIFRMNMKSFTVFDRSKNILLILYKYQIKYFLNTSVVHLKMNADKVLHQTILFKRKHSSIRFYAHFGSFKLNLLLHLITSRPTKRMYIGMYKNYIMRSSNKTSCWTNFRLRTSYSPFNFILSYTRHDIHMIR